MNSTLEMHSADLHVLGQIKNFLQTLLEALKIKINMVILGFLWALSIDPDLISVVYEISEAYINLWVQDVSEAFLLWLKGSVFQNMY